MRSVNATAGIMAEPTATALLEASISQVWNEHDGEIRLVAINGIYHLDARIYEPERSVAGQTPFASWTARSTNTGSFSIRHGQPWAGTGLYYHVAVCVIGQTARDRYPAAANQRFSG
jgi:hypothetical protein